MDRIFRVFFCELEFARVSKEMLLEIWSFGGLEIWCFVGSTQKKKSSVLSRVFFRGSRKNESRDRHVHCALWIFWAFQGGSSSKIWQAKAEQGDGCQQPVLQKFLHHLMPRLELISGSKWSLHQSWGGAGRCQGECGHYFGGAFLLGTWRCETFLSQSRHSWEPINPNDPTATLQTQAPLYGPDICPNGQNLKTQLFWWVKKDAWIFLWWFRCCRIWLFFVSDKWRQSNHQSIELDSAFLLDRLNHQPWLPWIITGSP